MSIGGDDLLAQIESENPRLGRFLARFVVPAIERTATNAGVSPTGTVPAPPPPESIEANGRGELLEIKINHAAAIQKGIQYITHISTDPSFSAPTIIDHHGTSRCPPLYHLPSKDEDGNTITYYPRSAAQMPGGFVSEWTYGPPVTLTGTTQMTLGKGKGAGTGSADGQQSLDGLGRTLYRPAPSPKRNVASGA